MRFLLILAAFAIAGCGHRPPIGPDVLDFPESLMANCQSGAAIDEAGTLSANLHVMVQNNILWAQCRVEKNALVDSIRMRQRALKAP